MDVQNRKKGRISLLCDDLLVLILNKCLDKYDRRSFSRVCKRWLKLERLNRLTLRVSSLEFFRRRLLTKFPNAVRIEISYVHSDIPTEEDLKYIAEACPQIETLKLRDRSLVSQRRSMEMDLRAVGISRCLKLTKVLLYRVHIGDSGVVTLLDSAHHLMSLTLGDNIWITDHALSAVASSSSIRILKLKGCMTISNDGIKYLAEGCTSKNLKKLVIKMCSNKGCCTPRITDIGFQLLSQMCGLQHLQLSFFSRKYMTDIGGVAISKIQTLKELKLGHVKGVSDTTIIALAENCPKLEMLHLTLVGDVTRVGIDAFSSHKCLKHLVLYIRNLKVSDLESMRLRLPSVRIVQNYKYHFPPCYDYDYIA